MMISTYYDVEIVHEPHNFKSGRRQCTANPVAMTSALSFNKQQLLPDGWNQCTIRDTLVSFRAIPKTLLVISSKDLLISEVKFA